MDYSMLVLSVSETERIILLDYWQEISEILFFEKKHNNLKNSLFKYGKTVFSRIFFIKIFSPANLDIWCI